ncbi:MAG: hypothetical protein K8S16_03490, partial [Bacteroidales bacterium]|nr:hypothetical protein [Bacteroidales bacterium]
SQDELNRVLFEDLKIETYDNNGCLIQREVKILHKGEKEDDLSLYKDLHPIIKPLLAFREIDSSISGFCDMNIYKKIRNGGYGKSSNIRLTIRLKKNIK